MTAEEPTPKANRLLTGCKIVGVADMAVSANATDEIVTLSLGSCLGVSVYDPVNKVGGLLHLMLPDSRINETKARTAPCMFVDTGVPRLIQSVLDLGADPARIVVKVAGGAQFLDPQRTFNVGERNIEAFTALLARHGHNPHAEDVGGQCSRTMRLNMATGSVAIHSPGRKPYYL